MRPIEFRVWDRRRGQMLHPMEISFDHSGRVTVFYGVDIDDKISCDQEQVMQFTGLRDKNGTRIYVSDILQFKPFAGTQWSSLKQVVSIPAIYGQINGMKDVEVIGNVHEHPELLKP